MNAKPAVMPKPDARAELATLCALYKKAEETRLLADTNVAELKKKIIALVERIGDVPAGAKKSKRAEAGEYAATVTWADATAIDKEAVEELRAELVAAGKSPIFKKLFRAETSYRIAPTANTALARSAEKRELSWLEKLFRRAIRTTPKAPALTVERKKR